MTSPRMPSGFLPIAALLALAACTDPSPSAKSMVRDSAGTRIVENPDSAWQDEGRWTVRAAPALAIGVEDGEAAYRFDGIAGAVRLGDGRIVVADGGTRQVRIFDAAGRHLTTSGREGAGPGEYGALNGLALGPGDTLLAVDGMQNRVTLLDAGGRRVRVVTMPNAPGGAPLWYVGRLRGGDLLLKRPSMLTPSTRPGLRRDSLTYSYGRGGSEAGQPRPSPRSANGGHGAGSRQRRLRPGLHRGPDDAGASRLHLLHRG